MQSVAEAIDVADQGHRLQLWKGLQPHVKIPVYLKVLRSYASWLPERIFSWLTADRIEPVGVTSSYLLACTTACTTAASGLAGSVPAYFFLINADVFSEPHSLCCPAAIVVLVTKGDFLPVQLATI